MTVIFHKVRLQEKKNAELEFGATRNPEGLAQAVSALH